MEWFFQTYFFCSGSIVFLVFILFVVGKITGWSQGTIFGDPALPQRINETQEEFNQRVDAEQADISRNIFLPLFIIVAVTGLIAGCMVILR